MLKAILQEMKARLQAECPFEVRYAHSRAPVPDGNKPFLLLDVKSLSAETPFAEGEGRIRYPMTASVSVTAAVPLPADASELQRILAAYVLPVMIRSGCSVSGFGCGEMTDDRLLKMHTAQVQFRLRGVYTVIWEEDADA